MTAALSLASAVPSTGADEPQPVIGKNQITLTGDRRATRIALTEAGCWLYETEIRPRIGAINQRSLTGFTPEESEQFQSFLKRMYRNLTGMTLD